jgi:hypothetical protein
MEVYRHSRQSNSINPLPFRSLPFCLFLLYGVVDQRVSESEVRLRFLHARTVKPAKTDLIISSPTLAAPKIAGANEPSKTKHYHATGQRKNPGSTGILSSFGGSLI